MIVRGAVARLHYNVMRMTFVRRLIWDAWKKHMTTDERTASGRIPEFTSREGEAAFWDTHDITDYTDELPEVHAHFAKPHSHGLTVQLDADTLTELRRQARAKSIGPTTLARMWILEHLQQQ